MSNQPTQILYGAGAPMELESATYSCPYCHCEILETNKDTHDARCARMNKNQAQEPVQSSSRQQTQNIGRQEQRDTNGLRITREHSSSSIPYPDEPINQVRQPQIRREARRVAENKLMTCANCDKSVREDDLTNHQRYECQGSDKIPCEFCDKQVSMTEYQSHVDHCPKRQEEVQQERTRSLERQRQEEVQQERNRSLERQRLEEVQRERVRSLERQRQNEVNLRQVQADQRRVNSAERRPTSNVNAQSQRQEEQQQQGEGEGHGFMNFLKNLATAALQNRHDVEDSTQPQAQTQTQSQNQQRQQQRQQREQEQQQQQQRQRQQQESQGQQPGFLARLLGFHPETPEEAEQRRQQRAVQQEREQERRRAEMQRRQQEAEMLQNLFEPRSQTMRGNQPQGRNVRTIRFGPHGSIMISSNNRGAEQVPLQGYQPRQMQFMEHEMEEMGPLGVLLSMMNGGIPGMNVISPEEVEGMTQEQQAGLAREVLDSLSVINYDTEKNKNVSDDIKSCPICIEDFTDGDEVRYLWCMHRFHKGCVDKWLEGHSNCPICKKEYSESEVSFE